MDAAEMGAAVNQQQRSAIWCQTQHAQTQAKLSSLSPGPPKDTVTDPAEAQLWHKAVLGSCDPRSSGQGPRVPCRSIAPSKLGANPPESQAPSGHAVLPAQTCC